MDWTAIGINALIVAFGCGIVYAKVGALSKTLEDHVKNPPVCKFHTGLEKEVGEIQGRLRNK